jgi:hypothetical protein
LVNPFVPSVRAFARPVGRNTSMAGRQQPQVTGGVSGLLPVGVHTVAEVLPDRHRRVPVSGQVPRVDVGAGLDT